MFLKKCAKCSGLCRLEFSTTNHKRPIGRRHQYQFDHFLQTLAVFQSFVSKSHDLFSFVACKQHQNAATAIQKQFLLVNMKGKVVFLDSQRLFQDNFEKWHISHFRWKNVNITFLGKQLQVEKQWSSVSCINLAFFLQMSKF